MTKILNRKNGREFFDNREDDRRTVSKTKQAKKACLEMGKQLTKISNQI
jgi:hypothetical protein